LGRFFENIPKSNLTIFGATFSTIAQGHALFFGRKNVLSYIFGHFFANTSGHPVSDKKINEASAFSILTT
jgi:hypothetical protein